MRGGSSASHPSMGDENPSLEIPMKNWSLKTPCLLLTGATPIKKTEKLSICEKTKQLIQKIKKQKQKKKNNTFQTNQTNPKQCKKQLQTKAKTQNNQINNTEQ